MYHLSKELPKIGKPVLMVLGGLTVITIIAAWFGISFVNETLDWVFITIPFLFFCVLVWRTLFLKGRIGRILGIVLMVIVFGIGYLSGSIGALGVGFVTASMESDFTSVYDDGIIYKEYSLGNAISDYRGKRVEISRKLKWIPFLERDVVQKSYYNIIVYLDQLKVEYDDDLAEFSLKATRVTPDSTYTWQDSFRIE
jgi:hypothetical protein